MKTWFIRLAASLAATLGLAGAAFAVEPLVDAAWAIANIGKPALQNESVQRVFTFARKLADCRQFHLRQLLHSL